jgi:inorganic pyrophosphatase
MLGRPVDVTVDRPLGSRHPRHPDLVYPLNYGFVPGTRSGDGAPIDAYLLGLDAPVATARGVVVAVVLRDDDVEDKLVVATDGDRYAEDEISAAVAFQERSFAHRIVTSSVKRAEAATPASGSAGGPPAARCEPLG